MYVVSSVCGKLIKYNYRSPLYELHVLQTCSVLALFFIKSVYHIIPERATNFAFFTFIIYNLKKSSD